MKKITLSAAILAVAMMGCSDAGLDNSVASTNEVKNEPAFLAKQGDDPGWPKHALIKQEDFTGVVTPWNFTYHTYDVGIHIEAKTYIDQGSNNAVGEFHARGGDRYRDPDYARVITLPLYNCTPSGQTASCLLKTSRSTGNNHLKVVQNYRDWGNSSDVVAVTETDNIFHPGLGYDYNKMNAITYYIAVWNEGEWNQVILAGTIFNGVQFQNNPGLAEKAYHRYFEPLFN